MRKAFTLIELLITIAIAALGALALGYYPSVARYLERESITQNIISDLRTMRSRAMLGENGRKWGAHFVNGADDYYELFSTPSDYSGALLDHTIYFPPQARFASPGEGTTKDVIFNAITGTAAAASIAVQSGGESSTITITAEGVVY